MLEQFQCARFSVIYAVSVSVCAIWHGATSLSASLVAMQREASRAKQMWGDANAGVLENADRILAKPQQKTGMDYLNRCAGKP